RARYLKPPTHRSGRRMPTERLRERVSRYTIRRRRRDIGGGIAFPGRDAVRVSIRMEPGQQALHERSLESLAGIPSGLVRSQALQQLASSWESLLEGRSARLLSSDVRRSLRIAGDDTHPKVLALLGRVLPRLPQGEKVLLFSRYRASQRSLLRILRQHGHQAIALVDRAARDRIVTVRRFREEPELRILICGEGAGEGLNLQFCSTLINFDLPWNPMRIEQRIGRIQRLGQARRRVSVINLVLEGTVEARVLHVLEHKLRIFKLFMGQTEQILGELLEERDQSFEAWVASTLLSNGRFDEEQLLELESQLEAAARRVAAREQDAGQIDRLLASPPEAETTTPPPSSPALDLSFLTEEGEADW
ncbi:MAG TPA: hypothetical protein ENK18_07925, partial [Deltaproteobacteria bacterium]|nr:hypothetical protein [Deltaproteobacteria bacterium]